MKRILLSVAVVSLSYSSIGFSAQCWQTALTSGFPGRAAAEEYCENRWVTKFMENLCKNSIKPSTDSSGGLLFGCF